MKPEMGRLFALIGVLPLLPLLATAQSSGSEFTSPSPPRSSKRGLVAISDISDPKTFYAPLLTPQSDISWYYNYGPNPTDALSGFSTTNGTLEFVPMLWGATTSNPGTGFADTVRSLISGGGHNISHILSFNEPDGCDSGGSCVSPQLAAQVWREQLAPLQSLSTGRLRVSAPAVTGSQRGLSWLQTFFTACNGGCAPDFLAVHWYGDFGGLAGFLGQLNASYAGNVSSLWVTEFAQAHADLGPTQEFYNMSTAYFDRLPFVERYAYFGSFRSSRSSLGINAAMFDGFGAPTDIGLWYAGINGTGAMPTLSGNGTDGSSNTSDAVGRSGVGAGCALVAALAGSAVAFLF